MNIKNQRPVIVPQRHVSELDQLSKSALMDVLWCLAMRCCGEEDDEKAMAEFYRERGPVLLVRKHDLAKNGSSMARITDQLATFKDGAS